MSEAIEFKKCSVCEGELKDYFWHFTTSQYMVGKYPTKQLQGYHGQTLCQECNEAALNALYDRYPNKVIPDFYCPKCSYLHSDIKIKRDEEFLEMMCFDSVCGTYLKVYKNGDISRYVNFECNDCSRKVTNHFYGIGGKIICPKCYKERNENT